LIAGMLSAGCALQTGDGHDDTANAPPSQLSTASAGDTQLGVSALDPGPRDPALAAAKAPGEGADPQTAAAPQTAVPPLNDSPPTCQKPPCDPSPQPWSGRPRPYWTSK
jgi:hypothetical protein